MFYAYILRIVFRNGLIAGLLIVVFAWLKRQWLSGALSPDLLLTLIALVFIGAGLMLKYPDGLHDRNIHIQATADPVVLDLSVLSKREEEVYHLLNTGCSNKEIAGQLCIELSTLKSHINAIYKKLEVKNRKELRMMNPVIKQ